MIMKAKKYWRIKAGELTKFNKLRLQFMKSALNVL